MLKVTYNVLGLYSLKKYNDGHMSSRSYPHAITGTIRGALLSSMIRRKGKEYAKENFYKLKHAQIFIQHPKKYYINQTKVRLISNTAMTMKPEKKVFTNPADVNSVMSVGIREQVAVDTIVFYIDETIDCLVEYLDAVRRIGNSESLVELKSIEKVSKMENILMPWNPSMGLDYDLTEDWDWETNMTKAKKKKEIKEDKGLTFEDIYLFTPQKKLKNKNKKTLCYIKDIVEWDGLSTK